MRALLRNDEVIVALVSAVCLMALAITLKNILRVSAAELSRDMVLFSVFYCCFWLVPYISAKAGRKSRFDTPVVWSLVVVAVTISIVVLYAV